MLTSNPRGLHDVPKTKRLEYLMTGRTDLGDGAEATKLMEEAFAPLHFQTDGKVDAYNSNSDNGDFKPCLFVHRVTKMFLHSLNHNVPKRILFQMSGFRNLHTRNSIHPLVYILPYPKHTDVMSTCKACRGRVLFGSLFKIMIAQEHQYL